MRSGRSGSIQGADVYRLDYILLLLLLLLLLGLPLEWPL